MKYEVSYDEKLRIIRSHSEGKWNVPDSDAATKEIVNVSRKHDTVHVLIDHSKLNINIPQYMAFNRPNDLKAQFIDLYPKVAFISPKGRHKLYQFFTLVAQNRGIQFKTFRENEEAMDWLLKDYEESTLFPSLLLIYSFNSNSIFNFTKHPTEWI
jgi:hypothetical protein